MSVHANNSSSPAIIQPKRKISFVCSGGGAKAGAFHLGVALALQERGFRFVGGLNNTGQEYSPKPMEISTYVGSSAGSIICAFLASGYTLENIFNSFLSKESSNPIDTIPKKLPKLTYPKMFKLRTELAKEQFSQLLLAKKVLGAFLRGNWEYIIESHWLKATGIFSTSGIEQYLREEVLPSNDFKDYLADIYVTGTLLGGPKKAIFGRHRYPPNPYDPSCEYFNDVKFSDACAASTALSLIYAPYQLEVSDGRTLYLVDGEIRDMLSSHVAVDAGSDLVIASYTHQPCDFENEAGSLLAMGLPGIIVQSIYLVIEHKIFSARQNEKEKKAAFDSISAYCKAQGISDHHSKKICEILEAELNYKKNLDRIYIHPDPRDRQMFIKEHFSLSPQKMADIVRSGFKAAITTLSRYDFADRPASQLAGVSVNTK